MKATQLFLAALFAGVFSTTGFVNAEDVRRPSALVVSPRVPGATETPLPVEGPLPPLGGAIEWLNSTPLSPASLRGKVVVIDFWTYTCINWRRTAPYLRAWAEKYKSQGLVVIGVHSPEFDFEKDVGNVRQAVRDMGLGFPIAIDSNHSVWRAFDNQYWPALYIADAKGRIRYHHFGEGNFELSERVIQRLLVEAGAVGVNDTLAAVDASGAEVAADWGNLKSPESYLGHGRTVNFASPAGVTGDGHRVYGMPERLRLNHWALAGDWTVRKQLVVSHKPAARIAYRFHARDVHLVMGPALANRAVRFRVLIDGQPPGAAHGVDIDADGNGTLAGQRMYHLIRQPGVISDRLFEIEFLDPGAEAFVFTFG